MVNRCGGARRRVGLKIALGLVCAAALSACGGPVILKPVRPAPTLPPMPEVAQKSAQEAAQSAQEVAPPEAPAASSQEDAPHFAEERADTAEDHPAPSEATEQPESPRVIRVPALVVVAPAAPTLSPDSAPDGPVDPALDFSDTPLAIEPEIHMGHDEKIELIVFEPTGRPAPLDRCDTRLCSSLLDLIEGAQETIDFAVYGLRNQHEIFDALMRAKKRGVRIRGVVDRTVDGKNYYSSTEKLVSALGTVRDDLQAEKRMAHARANKQDPFAFGRAPACPRPPGFEGPLQCLRYDLGDKCLLATHASIEKIENSEAIMHHKFFVVDGQAVWSGSTNVSDSCSGGYNANLVTVIRVPEIAEKFTEEFEQMWVKDRYHGEKHALDGPWYFEVEPGVNAILLFSPQHKPITRGVLPLLRKAKDRIDVAVFYLTHKGITEQLIRAHRRGVRVRVIVDATSATNGYTKHELLRVAGIPVKVEHWGGKMHMKSLVIDGHTVVTGSMNFTSAGEGGNDENTTIIESRRHAQYYEAMFQRMWEVIPDRWLEGRPHPESRDSSTACMDGVDNNHDHRVDDQDPGCGPTPPDPPPLPPHFLVEKPGRSCKEARFPGQSDDS